jgi:hemerythrin-like domain-containing protein
MRPTEDLKSEHEAVLVMLAILDKVAGRLEQKAAVPQEHFDQMLDFLRGFVDKCHHGKEETSLFPAMEAAGVPKEGGPIGVMLSEHEIGRGHVRQMAASAGRDGSAFAGAARAYITLLTQHIAKENGVLFPMADRVLSAESQARLEREFEAIEEKVVGAGKHEQFHAMLHRLKTEYQA